MIEKERDGWNIINFPHLHLFVLYYSNNHNL